MFDGMLSMLIALLGAGDYYIMVGEDHNIQPATFEEWHEWRENIDNIRVGYTIVGDYRVSTVFLGTEEHYNDVDDRLWFETMIFPADEENFSDLFMYRYTTYEDAKRGHDLAVSLLTEGKLPGELENVYRLQGSNQSE